MSDKDPSVVSICWVDALQKNLSSAGREDWSPGGCAEIKAHMHGPRGSACALEERPLIDPWTKLSVGTDPESGWIQYWASRERKPWSIQGEVYR